jgi:Recombinase zinc beta ribbon domain/Recombinase
VGAEKAEHARVLSFELTTFVLAADRAKGWDRLIGWEVHGGAKLLDLIAKGNAGSFEDAKRQAEAAWHRAAHTLNDSIASRPVPKGSRRLSPKCTSRRDLDDLRAPCINMTHRAGVLVWNRQRFIKDPNTGKRVSRPNSEAKWIRTEVPELRIVDEELWQRVKLRQAELARQFESTIKGVRAARAERLNRLRRSAFLLSGLLTCGCCGTRYGIVVNDRYGCLGHFRKGTCDNGRTIRRDDIERRVLVGLTDKLVSPEAVAVAVRAYAEETNRQNLERRARVETSRRALEKIERGIKGILDAIK